MRSETLLINLEIGPDMREIVLDTETTGLDPYSDHRLVEIGCIELINHMPSGRQYHQYINPQRPMPKEAFDVHGLGDDFLKDQPLFAEIADDFIEFIGNDSKLVIHNAAFDMKFLNAELGWLNKPKIDMARSPVPRSVLMRCVAGLKSIIQIVPCTGRCLTLIFWRWSILNCSADANTGFCLIPMPIIKAMTVGFWGQRKAAWNRARIL